MNEEHLYESKTPTNSVVRRDNGNSCRALKMCEDVKWSKGEHYTKSTKADKEKYMSNAAPNAVPNAVPNAAHNAARDYNQMKNLLFDDGTEPCMRISNKREDANTKLIERSLIMNVNQNPFLSQNNYINDLQIQDEFLKPKNSNFNLDI